MELSIILTTLLTATFTPDLCADVYVDAATGQPYTDATGQTWSRFCEWAGPSAPVLDLDVCCTVSGDTATCRLPTSHGRCRTGSKVSCDYGEVLPTGAVVCYQTFPSICDFGYCGDVMPPDGGPFENQLCCWSNGVCKEVQTGSDAYECAAGGGIAGYCWDGALYEDGTVECFDE